jgi:hypothetical protein
MKPKNTNVEILTSGSLEVQVSFTHKEINPNYIDVDVFIGFKESDAKEESDAKDGYWTLADANVKVYMPSSTIYEDIAYNPKSTWESHLINMIYDLEEQELRPEFKHLADLEFNPAPFFILHSISFVTARMDEILHVFLQAFFRQYPFGVLLLTDIYDDSMYDNFMSKEDKENLKNTFKHYGFESIDENGVFKYLEYESSTECCFEHEEKYYDKNMVLWNWFRNDCTQSVIRDCDE